MRSASVDNTQPILEGKFDRDASVEGDELLLLQVKSRKENLSFAEVTSGLKRQSPPVGPIEIR